MNTHYKSGQTINCPFCGIEQEGLAEDYVIPGRCGTDSVATDSCWECGREFEVENLGDGVYAVRSI